MSWEALSSAPEEINARSMPQPDDGRGYMCCVIFVSIAERVRVLIESGECHPDLISPKLMAYASLCTISCFHVYFFFSEKEDGNPE
jgi:hypothetical protein